MMTEKAYLLIFLKDW